MKDLAIYLHIPFCSSKCYYCDFASFPGLENRVEEYMDCMIWEMALYKDVLTAYDIRTIFIGGGTPSYIDGKYIHRLLEYIYRNFNCDGLEELSIETNPGTLDRDKLRLYRDIGVNRISMGVQSLDDDLLRAIGRGHTSKDFYDSYDLVRDMGFENVNLDLMFGLPGQTWEDCKRTLDRAIGLDVEHISYYSLILEEGTLFHSWYNDGRIKMPHEDLEREMYHRGIELLKDNGYDHYEISNFSRKGYECKHNLFYWRLKAYIGFGLSSHSNMGHRRFWNYDRLSEYCERLNRGSLPVEGEESIGCQMEMAEYMIMGLRLISGVNRVDFFNRFHVELEDVYGDVLKRHEAGGLLYMDGERLAFTPKGLDLSNLVYVDLLPE